MDSFDPRPPKPGETVVAATITGRMTGSVRDVEAVEEFVGEAIKGNVDDARNWASIADLSPRTSLKIVAHKGKSLSQETFEQLFQALGINVPKCIVFLSSCPTEVWPSVGWDTLSVSLLDFLLKNGATILEKRKLVEVAVKEFDKNPHKSIVLLTHLYVTCAKKELGVQLLPFLQLCAGHPCSTEKNEEARLVLLFTLFGPLRESDELRFHLWSNDEVPERFSLLCEKVLEAKQNRSIRIISQSPHSSRGVVRIRKVVFV